MLRTGPMYFPCSIIAACRCLTCQSGLACASAHAPSSAPSAKSKAPHQRARGLARAKGLGLLLAIGVVAAAAAFRDCAERRTHARLVLGARRRAEPGGSGLEVRDHLLHLRAVLEQLRLGLALLALRLGSEAVPGH